MVSETGEHPIKAKEEGVPPPPHQQPILVQIPQQGPDGVGDTQWQVYEYISSDWIPNTDSCPSDEVDEDEEMTQQVKEILGTAAMPSPAAQAGQGGATALFILGSILLLALLVTIFSLLLLYGESGQSGSGDL